MKKLLVIFFLGFLSAQIGDYLSGKCVDEMQRKCYPLWTQGKQEEYQSCMKNEKTLDTLSNVLGFNFVYQSRHLVFGY